MRTRIGLTWLGLGTVVLAACGQQTPTEVPLQRKDNIYDSGSIIGQEGITLFGPGRENGTDEGGIIGVNSFLWRASLDTISFMPIVSADPFGGVILTDWFSPPESPDERYKAQVYILDRQLRSDGIRVTVFRQELGRNGWQDAAVNAETARSIEDSILTRARQLRIAQQAAS